MLILVAQGGGGVLTGFRRERSTIDTVGQRRGFQPAQLAPAYLTSIASGCWCGWGSFSQSLPIFRGAQTHRAGQRDDETGVERRVRGGFSGCGRRMPSRKSRGWCALRGAGAGGSGDSHRPLRRPSYPPPHYPKLPPAPPRERTTHPGRRGLDPPTPGPGTPGTRYRPPTRPLGHFSHRTSPLSATTGFQGSRRNTPPKTPPRVESGQTRRVGDPNRPTLKPGARRIDPNRPTTTAPHPTPTPLRRGKHRKSHFHTTIEFHTSVMRLKRRFPLTRHDNLRSRHVAGEYRGRAAPLHPGNRWKNRYLRRPLPPPLRGPGASLPPPVRRARSGLPPNEGRARV